MNTSTKEPKTSSDIAQTKQHEAQAGYRVGQSEKQLFEAKEAIGNTIDALGSFLDAYSEWTYKIEAISNLAYAHDAHTRFKFYSQVMDQLSKELRNTMWHSEEVAQLIVVRDNLQALQGEVS